MVKLFLIVIVAVSSYSCTQMRGLMLAVKALPDDNPVEESFEWGVEQGIELLTGEPAFFDISGDSKEPGRK